MGAEITPRLRLMADDLRAAEAIGITWLSRRILDSVCDPCNGNRRQDVMSQSREVAKAGIGFGTALAIAITWSANKSLLWAVIHGLLSWFYVIYYAVIYHFN
jgi:hypothetical protein